MPAQPSIRIVIVGAGFGGIATAIELLGRGFTDLTLLEQAPELGGTWWYNTYPGAACDVPSHLYSYSFAQRRDWSRLCSPQAEILDYLGEVARTHGVARLVVPDTKVVSCAWTDSPAGWRILAEDGRTFEAAVLVLATGQLHRPAMPRIDGRETFAGHSFHSAQWDHAYDLRGKRVGVVGTGASSVQFVPAIAGDVQRLVVFQRTGNWFLPRKNRPYPPPLATAIRHVPGLQTLRRTLLFAASEALTGLIRNPRTAGLIGRAWSAAFMRWQLRDAELRRRIWPRYTFGCKRVLFSSRFLTTLQRPNVAVVTEAIESMTPAGIVTADGVTHELDCVVYATGFHANRFMAPMRVTGTGGRELDDAWRGGAHAHLGMTVPGFPSLFLLYGPNTNTSGGSIVVYLEAQAAYVGQAIDLLRDHRAAAIEVRPDVEAASDSAVQARFAGTAWTRCDSWYRDPGGRIVTQWPGYMREYVERTRVLDLAEYTLTVRAPGEPAQLSTARAPG
jgi:cation diffusion facilitator CzcD-associated flavoprotein CzcO